MEKGIDLAKQTRETARKARALRRLRDDGIGWEKAASAVGIIKEDGSPDPGLAYKIAHGYEPKRQEVRDRLDLRKLCTACMRGYRKSSSGSADSPAWSLWWRSLSRAERSRRIRLQYEKESE